MPKYKDGPTMRESISIKIALILVCLSSIAALYGLYEFAVWALDVLPAPGEY